MATASLLHASDTSDSPPELDRSHAAATSPNVDEHPIPSRSAVPLRLRRLGRTLLTVAGSGVLALFGLWFFFLAGETMLSGQKRLPIAESLLSVDDRPHPIAKIDSRGMYQIFEGVTIVMPANLTLHVDTFKRAHNLLYNRFSDILTPLPTDSYHITLSSIASRDQIVSLAGYNQHITDSRPRLEAVKHQLVDNAQHQQNCPPLTFTAADLCSGGSAFTLTMVPQSAAVTAELQRLIALIEPTLGPLYERQPRWHMTLAYRFKGLEIGKEQLEAVHETVMAVFRGVKIVVQPPVLCAFYDMRQFRPI